MGIRIRWYVFRVFFYDPIYKFWPTDVLHSCEDDYVKVVDDGFYGTS